AIDHAIAEALEVRQLVICADIGHEYLTLAARPGIAWALAGAGDVKLLVVGREAETVGVRHLLLGHHEIDAAGRVDAIAVGRQLAFARYESRRLADPRIELAAGVAGAAGNIGLALIELAAVRRVG